MWQCKCIKELGYKVCMHAVVEIENFCTGYPTFVCFPTRAAEVMIHKRNTQYILEILLR